MRRLFFIFLLAMLASPVYAAPVQDASIEKLLSLTDAKKLHDSVIADSDEIRIYRDTFTEKELNYLIAFYESPTGKMFVKKTPVILEKTSSVMQQKMVSILSRMNAMLEESMKQMPARH